MKKFSRLTAALLVLIMLASLLATAMIGCTGDSTDTTNPGGTTDPGQKPGPDGKVEYTVPEGTQSGTTFRFKGKGMPYVGYKNRGDQFVTVFVEVPTKLTKEQKELLRKFDEKSKDANAKKKSFAEKMKDLFD